MSRFRQNASLFVVQLGLAVIARAQTTVRVSVSTGGGQVGNSGSNAQVSSRSVSSDGRFVIWTTRAWDVVPGDTNGFTDVFIHDRQLVVTTRLNMAWNGAQSNADSYLSAISGDAKWVAFSSRASNLVPNDTNGTYDVFVVSSQGTAIERVDVSSAGVQANVSQLSPALPAISNDGRFVAFDSGASSLVAGDSNGAVDVFVRDRALGRTELVSVRTNGQPGNADSDTPDISLDGRFVVFQSAATTLVAGDTNGRLDIFLRDRELGTTTLVSRGLGGVPANGDSRAPTLSGDARFIAFTSDASNLVAGDTNGWPDVFVFDRQLSTTERASVSSAGVQSNFDHFNGSPALSFDGRLVGFTSSANNLVAGDTNLSEDIFLRDRLSSTTTRVNLTWNGQPNDSGGSGACSIAAHGQVVVFWSDCYTLIPNDTNANRDIFARDMCPANVTYYADADGDGWGDATQTIASTCFAPSGYVTYAGDCNDNDATVHPGAVEICNGVDDDCDGVIDDGFEFYADTDGDGYGDPNSIVRTCSQPVGYVARAGDCNDGDASVHPGAPDPCNGIEESCDDSIDATSYCTSSTTTDYCTPHIRSVGSASVAANSGFQLIIESVEPQRFGIVFYGTSAIAHSWAVGSTSTLCIGVPRQRTGVQMSGGTSGIACDGVLSLDWRAFMAANPGAVGQPISIGQQFFAQGWFRDPAAPATTNLSDALEYVLCP